MITCTFGQRIRCAHSQLVTCAHGQMITGAPGRWPHVHMVKWSHMHMVGWSHAHMVSNQIIEHICMFNYVAYMLPCFKHDHNSQKWDWWYFVIQKNPGCESVVRVLGALLVIYQNQLVVVLITHKKHISVMRSMVDILARCVLSVMCLGNRFIILCVVAYYSVSYIVYCIWWIGIYIRCNN